MPGDEASGCVAAGQDESPGSRETQAACALGGRVCRGFGARRQRRAAQRLPRLAGRRVAVPSPTPAPPRPPAQASTEHRSRSLTLGSSRPPAQASTEHRSRSPTPGLLGLVLRLRGLLSLGLRRHIDRLGLPGLGVCRRADHGPGSPALSFASGSAQPRRPPAHRPPPARGGARARPPGLLRSRGYRLRRGRRGRRRGLRARGRGRAPTWARARARG
jgi:hypothetical protein